MRAHPALLALLFCVACGAAAAPAPTPEPAPAPTATAAAEPTPRTATISIVGTNDLHGHIRALPLLAGYLANLRRARAEDGAVVLIDGGDMFQGTLESNLEEGASVVRAYEALGYDAVTIGNHEFDYGPVGPRATPREPGDDPRGALQARIAEAHFPFLSANLLARETGARADLGLPSAVIERAGVRIGVIGVTTEQTLTTTIAANVADLAVRPLADAIADEARALREAGVAIVLVAAHAGGRCRHFDDPGDLDSCDATQEIFEVARALPQGSVDAIVAGHTHAGVAHRVNGIAIIESFSYGVAFGRADLVVDRSTGEIRSVQIHPPRRLCAGEDVSPEDADLATCAPGDYEGAVVVPDARIAEVIAPAVARAATQRDRALGPVLTAPFEAHRSRESEVGNFFVDLMLRARPGADAAILNGGGLRADLPAGPLVYGALYEAFPFDNRFATVRMSARELAAMLAERLADRGSVLSLGGLRARARCESGEVVVTLTRGNGRAVRPAQELTVLTSDFLATGGDGGFARVREARPDAVSIEDDPPIREALVDAMAELGATQLAPSDYLDAARPRIAVPGARPVTCSE